MRIIDLLSKIANGEEVPKKIRYKTFEMKRTKSEEVERLYVDEQGYFFPEYYSFGLNDEVEVIEDNKKIEKLVMDYACDIEEKIFYEKGDKPNHCIVGDAGTELLIGKINEIIEVLNDKD